MAMWKTTVWRAMLAILITLPVPALADVEAQFITASGEIVVSGLSKEILDRSLVNRDAVRLTVKGQKSTRSMPLTLHEKNDALLIKPRFKLRTGTVYSLDISDKQFEITPQSATASVPKLESFTPSQAVIPANTLRFYLSFSEPMARGQLRNKVKLVRGNGSDVKSPFLNLETELWDREQRRATILLDPGRIKQGVGPNQTQGPPLREGESYKLIVSGLMKSAKGISLGSAATLSFQVGPAESRAIDPSDWQVLTPRSGTHSPFSVAFDRIMDSGAVLRLLSLQAPDGSRVRGEIETDGGGWSLTPTTPWVSGRYGLIIDPELEDVSGNTPGVLFDASAGTIGTKQTPIILEFNIAR